MTTAISIQAVSIYKNEQYMEDIKLEKKRYKQGNKKSLIDKRTKRGIGQIVSDHQKRQRRRKIK